MHRPPDHQFPPSHQERSFNEFLSRPEHRPQVEEAQRVELEQLLTVQEQVKELEFEQKVMAAGPDIQRAVAPFMDHPVLRRVMHSFANGSDEGLTQWASNPRVIEMLTTARSLLRHGRMTEGELETMLLQRIKSPALSAGEEAITPSPAHPRVKLAADQLVSALNEMLSERNQGSAAYRKGNMTEARTCYERALAIVNFVEGCNDSDQAEIERNKVSLLLNLAAVHNANQDYGEALVQCSQALTLDSSNVVGYLRQAKAHVEQHDFLAAKADLKVVMELDPGHPTTQELQERMKRMQMEDRRRDKALARKMLFGA
ncbi:MAG: hypothetical protein WDW38_000578 [Sanguina aurantia]